LPKFAGVVKMWTGPRILLVKVIPQLARGDDPDQQD
jgi:hypothetical protein